MTLYRMTLIHTHKITLICIEKNKETLEWLVVSEDMGLLVIYTGLYFLDLV